MKLDKPKRRHLLVFAIHEHYMARKFIEYARREGIHGTYQNLPGEWVVFRVPVPPSEQEEFIDGWRDHYAMPRPVGEPL